MGPKNILMLGLSALKIASALTARPRGECPSKWSAIASDLRAQFSGCNGDARASIRMAFHDCMNNGCDGSLILGGECTRDENSGLEDICNKIGAKATKYNVGTADMIQLAAAVALSTCPRGPQVRVFVGRPDSTAAAADGQLPETSDSVDEILSSFKAKGFSASDVVALVGAHTVAKQFFDDPSKAGASLDTTPATWDVIFYSQTLSGTAPYSFASDKRLSKDPRTEETWKDFSHSQSGWTAQFTDAWNRFSVLGNDVESLSDCSSLI